MELLKNTLYINLDHREDLKENVENQLKSINVTGERFSAIKTKAGCVGCTMSHIKCLELAIERKYEYVFICMDLSNTSSNIIFCSSDLSSGLSIDTVPIISLVVFIS